MKFIIPLLLFFLITFSLSAKKYQVVGKLESIESKQAIEFATIAVKNSEDKKIVTSLVTNFKGEFVFELESGKYDLEFRCMGYTTLQKTITVIDQDIYLKTCRMRIENNSIEEVRVVASSYKEKYDRSVQQVTKKLKEGASNVSDLLGKIKGISVNPLDNSIKVNNQGNVLLLVDGVKKEQGYVKNLPPDRIARIEITRNPTGRYISAGYSSVINVILKKNYSGFDLYAEEKGLYSLDQSNGSDFLFSNSATIDLTYTHKKMNVYTSYSSEKSNTNVSFESDKSLGNIRMQKVSIDGKPNSNRDALSHSFLLGTDLFLPHQQSISFETNFNYSPFGKNRTIQRYKNSYITDQVNKSFISVLNNQHSEKESYSLLSYRNKLGAKDKLEVDYSYHLIKSHRLNSYEEELLNKSEQEFKNDNKQSVLEINYQRQFSKALSLEIGYRNTYKKYEYNYLNSNSTGSENINKRNLCYSYLSIAPKGRAKLKFGLAVEQNKLNDKKVKDTYYSFQPFFSFYYKHSKYLAINAKLNSESTYPYVNQINPLEITSDRLTSEIGNSNLTFATHYKSSVAFHLFKNKLTIEPFYHFTKDYISQTGEQVGEKFRYTYSNLDRYYSKGVKISTKFNLIPRQMFLNLSAKYFRDKTEYDGDINRINDYTIDGQLIYIAPKYKTLFVLILRKNKAKKINAYGYNEDENDHLGCVVKQSFLKKRLALTLLYILPVDLGLSYTMNDDFEKGNFKTHDKVDIGLLKNLFMLKLSFNFNRGNEVKAVKKKNYKQKKVSNGFF